MNTNTQNPIGKFAIWFKEAKNSGMIDHTVMMLATATKEGKPSLRTLLLKRFDDNGFVFFTNYGGRKSHELSENPHAAICMHWDKIEKQVRIEGRVEKISDKESDEYFLTRPRESRLGAWVSKQSQSLESREKFIKELADKRAEFEGKEITRPPQWGGWRVIPERIEFWENGQFRIHQREVFTKENGAWVSEYLYP
jgi:pyridoxamine 5'-phosphate oxidase